MSTETKEIKNTLFRFITLRAPELRAEKDKQKRFVYRNEYESLFDVAVRNRGDLTKWQAMKNCSFAPLNRSNLESLIPKVNELAVWISKNKNSFDAELLIIEISKVANSFTPTQLNLLWDNLFYQIVTQKNFYLKESIIQLLIADHVYKNLATINSELVFARNHQNRLASLETELMKSIVTAKVVLPVELFIDEQKESLSNNFSKKKSLSTDNKEINRAIKRNATLEKVITNDSLIKLQIELKNYNKKFFKNRNKAYGLELDKYQKENYKINNEYFNSLEEILSISSDKITDEEREKRLAELGNPKLIEFNFKYDEELNIDSLKQNLSTESFNLFVSLFYKLDNVNLKSIQDLDYELNVDYSSTNEIINKLETSINTNEQEIINESEIINEQFVSVNGVLLNVQGSTTNSLSYTLSYIQVKIGFFIKESFSLSINVEDNTWGLDSVKFKANNYLGIDVEEIFYNVPVVNNQLIISSALIDKIGDHVNNLSIELYFENDLQGTIIIDRGIKAKEIRRGNIELSLSGVNNESSIISNGFGIKRLGVADYLRVEQTLHAYVPGEVSNIENVMASELRHKSSSQLERTENTITTIKSTEKENISDTTTTSRNEMQTEVEKVLQQDKDMEAHASYGKSGKIHYEIGGSYATHSSRTEAMRQASIKAQEVTSRAMDRIVNKVSEERVVKIINEFTENNVHEFDNRDGKKHITGVYRWVDKKMKNQIFNYGIRTMFEFMIPEPAKLHRLALTSNTKTIQKPQDPRTAPAPFNVANSSLVTETQINYWAEIYKVKLDELPEKSKVVNFSMSENMEERGNTRTYAIDLNIPENYVGIKATQSLNIKSERRRGSDLYVDNLADGHYHIHFDSTAGEQHIYNFSSLNVPIGYNFDFYGYNLNIVEINIKLTCELSQAFMTKWKSDQLVKIIEGYDVAYKVYEDKVAEEEAKAKEIVEKEQNNNFYRIMEEVLLKHNCIAYLIGDVMLGKEFTSGDEMKNFKVLLGNDLDQYTSLAKFMEQAFEWEIMSYKLYPYYWAGREQWSKLYLTENMDPLFRSFLQAGMARVIVTVNPGFEQAVQFFMETGKIWNGGEVPVIGDPLYESIVDEMRAPLGKPQGKAWITKIPTSLNILQAQSVGLEVVEPLPHTTEDPTQFELPEDVVVTTEFNKADILLAHSGLPSTLNKN